jgi:hypothetical protein
MLLPSSWIEEYTEQGISWLPPAFKQVSCSASSTLKMEATCPSETSVDFQLNARPYIPADETLHSYAPTRRLIYSASHELSILFIKEQKKMFFWHAVHGLDDWIYWHFCYNYNSL